MVGASFRRALVPVCLRSHYGSGGRAGLSAFECLAKEGFFALVSSVGLFNYLDAGEWCWAEGCQGVARLANSIKNC